MGRLARVSKFISRQPVRFWIMLICTVLSLIAFEEVYDDVFRDPNQGDFESEFFDKHLMTIMREVKSPALTQVMTDLTALGSVSVIATLFAVFASILLSFRDYKGLIYVTTVLAGAGFWPLLLKPFFDRDRPDEGNHLAFVNDLSFPSGHSFGAAAVYIALAFYSGRYAKSWHQEVFFYCLGAVVVCLVGTSRIYLGVHYPTDVLAGISGGAAWAFAISTIYCAIVRTKKSH